MTKLPKRALDRRIAKVAAHRKQAAHAKTMEARMEKLRKAATSASIKAKKLTVRASKMARKAAENAPETMEKFRKWQKKMKKMQDPMWRQMGW
jgi:hypothetical protein